MIVRGDARQAKAELMTRQNPLVSYDYCSERHECFVIRLSKP